MFLLMAHCILPVLGFSLPLGLHPHYVPQLGLQVQPIKICDPGKLKLDLDQACSMGPESEVSCASLEHKKKSTVFICKNAW